MNIIDKINTLITDQQITKREFAKRLLSLDPRLISTGEPPNEVTIYRYLSKERELKVELVPYIAQVLGISESELFSYEVEYAFGHDTTMSKEAREIVRLLQFAPATVIHYIKTELEKFRNLEKEMTGNFPTASKHR